MKTLTLWAKKIKIANQFLISFVPVMRADDEIMMHGGLKSWAKFWATFHPHLGEFFKKPLVKLSCSQSHSSLCSHLEAYLVHFYLTSALVTLVSANIYKITYLTYFTKSADYSKTNLSPSHTCIQ